MFDDTVAFEFYCMYGFPKNWHFSNFFQEMGRIMIDRPIPEQLCGISRLHTMNVFKLLRMYVVKMCNVVTIKGTCPRSYFTSIYRGLFYNKYLNSMESKDVDT